MDILAIIIGFIPGAIGVLWIFGYDCFGKENMMASIGGGACLTLGSICLIGLLRNLFKGQFVLYYLICCIVLYAIALACLLWCKLKNKP